MCLGPLEHVCVVIDPSVAADRFGGFCRYLNSCNWEARPPNANNDTIFIVVDYHGTRRVRKYTTMIYVRF